MDASLPKEERVVSSVHDAFAVVWESAAHVVSNAPVGKRPVLNGVKLSTKLLEKVNALVSAVGDSGYSAGSFSSPGDDVTRAEVVSWACVGAPKLIAEQALSDDGLQQSLYGFTRLRAFELLFRGLISRHSFEDAKEELSLQVQAGELDIGDDSGDDRDRGDWGTCFYEMCEKLRVNVPAGVTSVYSLSVNDRAELSRATGHMIHSIVFNKNDHRNHVAAIEVDTANTANQLHEFYKFVHTDPEAQVAVVKVSSPAKFFDVFSREFTTSFYSREDDGDFGQALRGQSQVGEGRVVADIGTSGPAASAGPAFRPAASVTGEDVRSGGSNISGGVVRAKRRKVPAKSLGALGGPVQKSYRASNAVMYNNAEEMYQDMMSRDYVQEVIEELFELWRIPKDQPKALKYAEDLLTLFIIANTASNKADYNQVFAVPIEPIELDGETVTELNADFAVFSNLLESGHNRTRRQFSRGFANDQRDYLKHEDNTHLPPQLASRLGCESLMGYLAFDGSTHCTGLTTRELTFVKTLESRNLFERDDVIAQGSSDRLMAGVSGGVRSVAPR